MQAELWKSFRHFCGSNFHGSKVAGIKLDFSSVAGDLEGLITV